MFPVPTSPVALNLIPSLVAEMVTESLMVLKSLQMRVNSALGMRHWVRIGRAVGERDSVLSVGLIGFQCIAKGEQLLTAAQQAAALRLPQPETTPTSRRCQHHQAPIRLALQQHSR